MSIEVGDYVNYKGKVFLVIDKKEGGFNLEFLESETYGKLTKKVRKKYQEGKEGIPEEDLEKTEFKKRIDSTCPYCNRGIVININRFDKKKHE